MAPSTGTYNAPILGYKLQMKQLCALGNVAINDRAGTAITGATLDALTDCTATYSAGFTEPVTATATSTTLGTWVDVTGVYTPTSGQDHDKACAAACATTACSATGTWADAAAILHADTGCAGCMPQNPETDVGCFPGAAGYPTTVATSHDIGGLTSDKYYVFRVAAHNHYGTSPWSTQSYAVHTHSAPTVPTWASTAVTSVAAAGTGLTLNWAAGDPFGTGTDECAGRGGATDVGSTATLACSRSNQVAFGACDTDLDGTISGPEATACACLSLPAAHSGTAAGDLKLATAAGTADDAYNGLTITTAGDVIAVGVITDYTGSDQTFTAVWSYCADGSGSSLCSSTTALNTPTTSTSTTYVIHGSPTTVTYASATSTCSTDGYGAADSGSASDSGAHTYTVKQCSGSGCDPASAATASTTWSGLTSTTYAVTGLTAGSTYVFSITATNAAGSTAMASSAYTSYTMPSAPAQPLAPAALAVEGNEATVSWAHAVDQVDAPNTIGPNSNGFILYAQSCSPSSTEACGSGSNGWGAAVRGSLTSDGEDLIAAAEAALGRSASATNPDIAFPSDAGSTITSESDGDYLQLTYFSNQYYTDSSGAQQAMPTSGSWNQRGLSNRVDVVDAVTVPALLAGTHYRFKVAFVNAAGTGPLSAASQAVVTPDSAISSLRIYSGPPCVYKPGQGGATTFAASSEGSNVKYRWELVTASAALMPAATATSGAIGSGGSTIGECKDGAACSVMEYTLPYPGDDSTDQANYDEIKIRVLASNGRGIVTEELTFGFGDGTFNTNSIEYCGCTDSGDDAYWAEATYMVPSLCTTDSFDSADSSSVGASNVPEGQWEYFQFFFDADSYAAEVTVRVDTGTVDVYVSATEIPDAALPHTYYASQVGVSNFFVADLPYAALEPSAQRAVFVAVKGAAGFSRFQVLGRSSEFQLAPGTAGASTRERLQDVTTAPNGLTKTVQAAGWNFFEFYYPHAENDIDVQLIVTPTTPKETARLNVYSSLTERYPSPNRATGSSSGYWTGTGHSATDIPSTNGDATTLTYTVRPQDQSGNNGVLYVGVQGVAATGWAAGDRLPSASYTIQAKVYRYSIESSLLDPVTAPGVTGDDTTRSVTAEARYNVASADNMNYYEIVTSDVTKSLTLKLTVHYGTAKVYVSSTTLPTQDETVSTLKGTHSASSTEQTITINAIETNIEGKYVYVGIFGAGGETSYDLTVEETTFGVVAPTDLYFCAEGTDVRSYTLSTVASDAACTKLPGAANPVCNSATSDVPCPVCTTALATTDGECTPTSRLAGGWPGSNNDGSCSCSVGTWTGTAVTEVSVAAGEHYYQLWVGPADVNMETASRSGAGSLPSNFGSSAASWGLDWTMPMTTTWVDSKADEWDLDLDISFASDGGALTAASNEYFQVFASQRERYPSSERAYDTAVISSTVAEGASTLYTVAGAPGYGFATTGTGACTEVAAASAPASLGACMTACDGTTGCDAIQWDNTNCKQLDCPATPALAVEAGEQAYTKAAHGATSMVLPHYTFSGKMVYVSIIVPAGYTDVEGQFILTKSEMETGRSLSSDPSVSASGCVSSTDPAVDTCSTNGNCIDDSGDGEHKAPYCVCSDGYTGADCSVAAFSTATTISVSDRILGMVATGYTWNSGVCKTRNSWSSPACSTGNTWATDTCNRKTGGVQNTWEPFVLIGTGKIKNCQELPNLVAPDTGAASCQALCTGACNAFEHEASTTCKLFTCPRGSNPVTTAAATNAGSWGVNAEGAAKGYHRAPFTCCGVAEDLTATSCATVLRGYYDEASCETVPGASTQAACETVTGPSTQAACEDAPVASGADACELKPHDETPTAACPPAAVAAGISDCDAFDAVALDCSTQKCTPTGSNPYKIGYVTCPGGVCTINAPKPLVEIPFSVAGLPANSKVVTYVDSQPYPAKGANALHYAWNCEASDTACVATATATAPAHADSVLKIYDLKPLPSGKKHTAVMMLLTDAGEPLGTVLQQFGVGYSGGCTAAPDGSVCGGQGACYLGYCVCYDGYFGTNCERTIDEDGSVCAAESGNTQASCEAADGTDVNYDCVWDAATSLCSISVVTTGFTAGSVYEARETQLRQSKMGEARFLNTRMLEANAASLAKSDGALATGTSGTQAAIEASVNTVVSTVANAKAATLLKVEQLHAKTERNAIKVQQAHEESLRLQTSNLEAKLEMQRSLAAHQTEVQNRFQTKRFDVYKLNALKQDKLKQEFARSRFTLNQLLTSNGPTVDPMNFRESTCTTDQFYNVECTETVTDK